MVLLTHVLAIVAYGLGSFFLGLVVFKIWPELGGAEAASIGALTFVAAALAHEVFSRLAAFRRLGRAVTATQQELTDASTNLDLAHREIAQLRDELGAVENLARQRIDSEVAVVKTLLGRLYQHLEGAPSPTPAPAAPYVAPLPSVHDTGDDAAILDAIRDALENNRIDLYLQPVVSLPQRKVRYFEAFSRLRDASGRILTPDHYLAVAERSGMIATIDNLLLFRCTQLLRKMKRLKKNISFFCNLSDHTLHDDKFFAQFTDFLASQPGLAENMIFEVGNAELASGAGAGKLDRLKAMGFRLSLDQVPDLNIDYAGLARRNFRFVKIEATKLLSVANQARAPIAPIDLKEALRRNGIDLIAEKIESERTVIDLMDFDVDYGQGYLFGEPRPAREDINLTDVKVA